MTRRAKKRTASPRFSAIPTRKISETILDFGEPLLRELDDEPPMHVVRNALNIVIAVWNAHVFALAGKGQYLESLAKLVDGIPPEVQAVVAVLHRRRQEQFSSDPRLVGEWDIVPDGRGGHALRCEARVPQELMGSS